MTKQKTTKKALLLSALALFVCIAMFIGSTYAWFTDSVTSGSNVIEAGTLDIVMEYWDGDSWEDAEGEVLEFIKGGNYHGYVGEVLWEPGCTYELPKIRVRNEGNLAAKVLLKLNGVKGDEKLMEAIELKTKISNIPQTVLDGSYGAQLGKFNNAAVDMMYGTPDGTIIFDWSLMGKGHTSLNSGHTDTSPEFTISGHMKEEAGNEYQGLKIEGVSITALATQEVYEYDSFGREYDKDATFPNVVTSVAELKEAVAEGGTFALSSDLVINEKVTVDTGKEVVLDLNGNTLSAAFDNIGVSAAIENKGTLTIKNGKVVSLAEFPDVDWGSEGFPTYATNTISNRGNLVIEDGAVIENQTNQGGASYAVDNYAGATLTVNGGKIIAKDVAIRMFSGSATAEDKVVINGGTITGKRAIWIQLPSNNSAVAPKTTVEINGGELTGTQMCIYSYSYGNSFVNTNVTIKGGTFNGDVQFGGGYKGDKENVSVIGGTFNGKLGRWITSDVFEDIAKP